VRRSSSNEANHLRLGDVHHCRKSSACQALVTHRSLGACGQRRTEINSDGQSRRGKLRIREIYGIEDRGKLPSTRSRGGNGRRRRGQREMLEDLSDGRGIGNRGQDPAPAVASGGDQTRGFCAGRLHQSRAPGFLLDQTTHD